MPVDRANIEIGTPTKIREVLLTMEMRDRPKIQRIAKMYVKLERSRIRTGLKSLLSGSDCP